MFWGAYFSGSFLKGGMPDEGFEPFSFQGEVLGFEFCLSHWARGGVFGETDCAPACPTDFSMDLHLASVH